MTILASKGIIMRYWNRSISAGFLGLAAIAAFFGFADSARAGKLGWLDDVVREVVREARVEGKTSARGIERGIARESAEGVEKLAVKSSTRILAREGEEGLDVVARGFERFGRAGRELERPSEALLDARFARLGALDPEMIKTFRSLDGAEKRLVVEMGETAQMLAREFPNEAEAMIRKLGPEGMSAARAFGPEVAATVAKEGPETLGILRKTGRGGLDFFTKNILPNKKKLLAAGVLAAFLANPDLFVDSAGRFTKYAAEQFARAGVQLAGAASSGVARGLVGSITKALAGRGVSAELARILGIALASLVAVVAALVFIGKPIRAIVVPVTRPIAWMTRRSRSK